MSDEPEKEELTHCGSYSHVPHKECIQHGQLAARDRGQTQSQEDGGRLRLGNKGAVCALGTDAAGDKKNVVRLRHCRKGAWSKTSNRSETM